MKEEALKQAKQLYLDLLAHFEGSPIKIAIAFDFIHEGSEIKGRKAACARVGMWKHVGVPKKYMKIAEEFLKPSNV